jgi:electron transfer flavoprotein beta subunit
MLDLPLLNIVTSVDVINGFVKATRDIDGGKEELECATPCVVSAQKELCEPRIPNMRGIMGARTKPLQVVTYSGGASQAAYIQYELPPAKSGVRLINPDNAGELIDILHNEKKII